MILLVLLRLLLVLLRLMLVSRLLLVVLRLLLVVLQLLLLLLRLWLLATCVPLPPDRAERGRPGGRLYGGADAHRITLVSVKSVFSFSFVQCRFIHTNAGAVLVQRSPQLNSISL